MQLQLATGNAKKVAEFKALLEPLGFDIIPAPEGFSVVEDAPTFAQNAIKKATALMASTQKLCVADDSGLMVDALHGAPGVYSARYASVDGPGQDAANRRKLLQALLQIPAERRGARFVCAIALCGPGRPTQVFEGEVRGHIALHEYGSGGFGYDPLFVPTGQTHTFASMPAALKHTLSHRGHALRALAAALAATA